MSRIRSPRTGGIGSNEFLVLPTRLGSRGVQSSQPDGSLHRQSETCLFDDWIDEISRSWKGGPKNTLELARVLRRTRGTLAHGQWTRLWRDKRLPFGKRKAEMLVVIGEELNANNCAHLPSSWRTLYCIARLGQALADRLIAQKRIHRGLRLSEARELVAEFRPDLAQKNSTLSTLERRLLRFSRFVLTHALNWSPGDRRLVRAELKHLLDAVPQRSSISLNNPNCREHKHI